MPSSAVFSPKDLRKPRAGTAAVWSRSRPGGHGVLLLLVVSSLLVEALRAADGDVAELGARPDLDPGDRLADLGGVG